MGETLEENWAHSGSEYDSSDDEQNVLEDFVEKPSVEQEKQNNSDGQMANGKRKANDADKKGGAKKKKQRGLRSLARAEDAGLLSIKPERIAETFWGFYGAVVTLSPPRR